MEFKTELKKYATIVNAELEKVINKENCQEQRLNEAMNYSLMAGGKRLRPTLMLASYKLFKDDIQKVYPFMCAMEMIHNFSLIHDDLPAIDNDDYRHGILTNHKKFDESTAILAGDKLLNDSYMVVLENILQNNISTNVAKALYELSNSTSRMIAGEYIDIECEGKEISTDLLEYMCNNKTGELIKASVRIGAILGDASQDELNLLTNYAKNIGLAFQIKDDILDETGEFDKVGKALRKDKDANKSTFVTKYGLETAQNMLEKLIQESIEIISTFGSKGTFFKDLAIYIQNREL